MNLASLLHIPSLIVPEHVAVIDHRTAVGHDVRTSMADLWARAAAVNAYVRSYGVGHGERVAIVATNSSEVIAAIFGIAAAGAVAVPMNVRAAREEFVHLLGDSGARLIVAEPRYVELLDSAADPSCAIVAMDDRPGGWDVALESVDPVHDLAGVDPGDLAVLLYTSGTTSRPKGVRITHAALTSYSMESNDAPDGSNDEVMLLSAPLHHVAGLTSMVNSIYSGRTTVVLPQFAVDTWLAAVAEHGVTHAFVVPTMLHRLCDAPQFDPAGLTSLRNITYGAAPMPGAVITRALELFPPTVEFSGAYGQTETTSTVAVLGPDDHRLTGPPDVIEARRRRLGSVGKVVDDVEVRVVDDDDRVLPPNEIGEVCLRTARASDGYWGAGGADVRGGDGWIHTGDLGFLDPDGYLFLTGRRGDMIIRGGENVAPEEIEDVLLHHADITDVGVVGIPDPDWGERVVAAVVLRGAVSVADVEEYAREHLAPFKRPSEYVVVGELPRTPTGKLVRRDLVATLTDAPSGSAPFGPAPSELASSDVASSDVSGPGAGPPRSTSAITPTSRSQR